MMKLRMRLLGIVVLTGMLPGVAGAKTSDAPPHVQKAMRELWRRGHCLLSSVYKPAGKESAVPRDIGDVPVVEPHVLARQGRFLCYAVDARTIWAADDQRLIQVDGATGKVLKELDRRSGLSDAAIQSIAPAAEAVWLAGRGCLARLDRKSGKVSAVPGVRFGLGRLATGPGGVWLVSDAGAFRLAAGKKTWRKLPDFPGLTQLAQTTARGFWSLLWRKRQLLLIPSIFARADGLYVVCNNRLLRYVPGQDKWQEIAREVWQAMRHGRSVWAMTTHGVVRYDPSSGKAETFRSGQGPAAGRPIAMAATSRAFFLASQPDYDSKAKRFVGGGISRFSLADKKWTVTQEADGVDVRFVSTVAADGDALWAASTLYDKVVQLGAHPGMAHVKRWRPHTSGLALLHYRDGKWTLQKRDNILTEQRWVMGQKNTVNRDHIGPKRVDLLCPCGGCVWGVYRMIPERYYAGYFISAGCLAARAGDGWQGRFDVRTKELGFEGEQPELMLISHSHGQRIVLADGHPVVLGVERVADRAWVISEGGLFVHDEASGKFSAAARVRPRLYWRATAAAPAETCVWFGGDGGTVSRLDRATGLIELLGVAEGRKIAAIGVAGDRVVVRTDRADAVLPVSMKSTPRLPDGATLVFDGQRWSAGKDPVKSPATAFTGRGRSNYLYKGRQRVAFLKGVFRPRVLCEDRAAGKLWLGTYSGVASVPLPGKSGQ